MIRAINYLVATILLVACLGDTGFGQRGGRSGAGRSASGGTRSSPGGRSGARVPPGHTNPRGTEGHSTARGRAIDGGLREQRERRKRGDSETNSNDPKPGSVSSSMSEADRIKFQRKFLADLEKRFAKIKNAAIDFNVLLLPGAGKVRRLEVRYRYLRMSKNLTRHRVVVVEKNKGRYNTIEDFILHETRGSRITAWRRTTAGMMMPYRGNVLSHKIGGSSMTLENLLPFDHSRYRAKYQGIGFRDGRRTDIFVMKPGVRGASKVEVAYRRRELVPCRWRAYRGDRRLWGAVASAPRIRDGIHVLERRTVQFAARDSSAVIKVRSRKVNAGVDEKLFDPKNELDKKDG